MDRRSVLAAAFGASIPLPAMAVPPTIVPRRGKSGIYAKAGEKTYCRNGCHLGTFARNVMVGALPKEGDLLIVPPGYVGMVNCPFCNMEVGGGIYMMGSK